MTASKLLTVEAREYPDLDAADVWTVLADPARLGDWFPLAVISDPGGADPGPGVEARVSWWGRTRPAAAWRVVVTEWEAGTSYRCRLDRVPGLRDSHLTVAVEPRPSGGGTRVVLRLEAVAADAPRATLYRLEASRRLRRALRRLPEVVGR